MMRARRWSEEPIIPLLPQAARGEPPISLLCREHGMTETTCDRRRQPCGGMRVSEAPRLRALEKAHARLNRLRAERARDGAARRA